MKTCYPVNVEKNRPVKEKPSMNVSVVETDCAIFLMVFVVNVMLKPSVLATFLGIRTGIGPVENSQSF